MQAYIEIRKEEQEKIDKHIMTNLNLLVSKMLVSDNKVKELEFDFDLIFKDKENINFDKGSIYFDKTDDVSLDIKRSIIKKTSTEVFDFIIVNMKEFDTHCYEVLTNKEYNLNLDNTSNTKQLIKLAMNTDGRFLEYTCSIVATFIRNFGIVRNVYDNNHKLLNKCNILELIYKMYQIYTAYYLNETIYLFEETSDLKIYNLIDSNIQNNKLKIINNILLENEKIGSSFYVSRYDKEEYLWKLFLVFENALSLAFYELRMLLSGDGEYNRKICKNKECLKPFKSSHKGQLYCKRKECIISRQNQRQRESYKRKKI